MLKTIPETVVVDTEGAASYLGLSASWLEKLRVYQPDAGPRFLRLGRVIRYRVEDLEAWAAARAVGGGQ